MIDGIARARAALGHDSVAALMTTTEDSLRMAVEIVDEYVKQGFSSIFLRSRSPYGFAARRGSYSAGEWHQFYRRALGHIVDLNMKGTPIREEFTAMLLQRMLTDQPTGYVDLQSPAGLGLGALVINYDGMVYASDESRMLAEMGDHSFLLGPVAGSSVDDLVGGDKLAGLLFDTMTEGVPMCVDCAFQPWCGADPVLHHATQGDAVGYKPSSEHCSKYMSAFEEILGLLHSDTATSQVLRSWVRP